MSHFFLLDSSRPEEWHFYLNKIEETDIYYTAEYCKLCEQNGEGKAKLFVYQEDDKLICYPFLMKNLDQLKLPANSKIGKDIFDISTPYGYGGPLTNEKDPIKRKELFGRFSKIFGIFCRENAIVTEFVRFHPIAENNLYYDLVNPENIRSTISIELSDNEEEILSSFTNKCRNRVRHALKHDLKVEREDHENIKVFMDQYYATMEKNNANSYYFFSEDYFRDSLKLLNNHIDFFSVKYKDKVIASTFFLHYNGYVSYHLTGSDKEYLKFAPYNLLIYYAACWYGKQGYKHLHLGGGYFGNEDELFRFKKTFSKKDPLNFFIGKKVHCCELYQLLTKNIETEANYFPLYRDPNVKFKVGIE